MLNDFACWFFIFRIDHLISKFCFEKVLSFIQIFTPDLKI